MPAKVHIKSTLAKKKMQGPEYGQDFRACLLLNFLNKGLPGGLV